MDKFREILLKSKEVNNATVPESSTIRSGVKLPKIFIKRFSAYNVSSLRTPLTQLLQKMRILVTLRNLRICEDIYVAKLKNASKVSR